MCCVYLQYGDLIQTMDDAQQKGFFRLPASAGAANCLDTNPAGNMTHPYQSVRYKSGNLPGVRIAQEMIRLLDNKII